MRLNLIRLLPCNIQLSALAATAIALQALTLGGGIALTGGGSAIAQTTPISPASTTPDSSPATQHLVYVNPITGNDTQAEGGEASPFRTITRALQSAQPQTIILLAAGTYSAATGEVFP